MADIFNYQRNPKANAVFSTDGAILNFSDQAGGTPPTAEGLLVQSWSFTYNQQITETFELGSSNLYWVKGRPQGSGEFRRIVGPAVNGPGTIKLLPNDAYDACAGGAAVTLSVGNTLCGVQNNNTERTQVETAVRLKVDGLIVNSISFNANVQDTRINEGISFRFTFLDVEETDASLVA